MSDYVGSGLDLEPATLLAAYAQGLFPMPDPGGQPELDWFSPDPRGVLPLTGLRVSRSLRRACRRFTVTVDQAFDEVMLACADPSRRDGWINEEFRQAYGRLHTLGHAHSVEVRDSEGALAGGLYGVGLGGLFAGESMFHRQTDASKVALVALVAVLTADGVDGRLLDVQWATAHLSSLGVVEVSRRTYLRRLDRALQVAEPAWRVPPWPPAGQPERRTR